MASAADLTWAGCCRQLFVLRESLQRTSDHRITKEQSENSRLHSTQADMLALTGEMHNELDLLRYNQLHTNCSERALLPN